MITPQSTIIELKAEAYTVLKNIENSKAYLNQLNQIIAQKEEETKTQDIKKTTIKSPNPQILINRTSLWFAEPAKTDNFALSFI